MYNSNDKSNVTQSTYDEPLFVYLYNQDSFVFKQFLKGFTFFSGYCQSDIITRYFQKRVLFEREIVTYSEYPVVVFSSKTGVKKILAVSIFLKQQKHTTVHLSN